jgi:hypothetical protein
MFCRKFWLGLNRYLQRVGDIDPDMKQSCSIGRGVTVALQPYCHVLQERRFQPPFLALKRNLKMADDPFDPDDSQPGHSSHQ